MITAATQRRDNKMDKYSKVYKKLNELRLQEIDKICEIYDSGHLSSSVALNIPTDFIEVVRCKDCIYHTENDECTNGRWDNWSNSDYELYPEALEMDYCSYGVRKNG